GGAGCFRARLPAPPVRFSYLFFYLISGAGVALSRPPPGAARGWLFSIVRHEALNVVRGRLRLVTPDEDAAEAIDAEVSLAASAGRADAGETRVLMGRLNDCLDHLDEPRRNSLMFAYLDGCSHSEIAARLGAPLGSVKAWIRRGLQSLRECMQ
ncbi:sigma-70 family RNA polymerase sigma factor, partial [Cupriavidus plantarum]|uniref:sigma-70 family RNA polymerase sigma factor n=1 Tax=Cupriavidus plantarum TaxID=942865 RepID=UPI00339D9FA3